MTTYLPLGSDATEKSGTKDNDNVSDNIRRQETHESRVTYLQLNKKISQSKCLSLSCGSIDKLIPSEKKHDLNNTMMNDKLAKHFLLQLWKKDEKDSNKFGYAAKFQFYLDFYALAVQRIDSKDENIEFPAKPAKYTRDKFELADPKDPVGWIKPRNFHQKLKQEYWTSHPLRNENQDKVWIKVGKVIEDCSDSKELTDERKEEMLETLVEAVRNCKYELLKMHKEFKNDGIDARKKGKRCQIM